MYAGVANKARRVAGAYVGVGGVARKVRGIYSGDEAGIARVVWGKGFAPGVITPANMTGDSAPSPFRSSAKSVYSTEYVSWKAFNSATGDSSCAGGNGSVPAGTDIPTDGEWWIQVDLGVKKAATQGRWRTRSGGNWAGANEGLPADFQILGSNDDTAWNDTVTSGKWIVTGSFTDYPQLAAETWCTPFILDSPGYYRYWRMKVTRSTVAGPRYNCIIIAQLELSAV